MLLNNDNLLRNVKYYQYSTSLSLRYYVVPDIVLTGQNRPRCQFPVTAVSPWKHNACSVLRKAVQKQYQCLFEQSLNVVVTTKLCFNKKSYRVQTEAFMGPVHLLLTRWACTFWVQFHSSHSHSQCAKYCHLRKSSASHYVDTKGVCIFIVISLITTRNIYCQYTDRKGIDGATSQDDFITKSWFKIQYVYTLKDTVLYIWLLHIVLCILSAAPVSKKVGGGDIYGSIFCL